jgi:hypothetical protein
VVEDHEIKASRVEKESQFAKEDAKRALDRCEAEVRERFESEQAQVQSQFQTEFDREKAEYTKEQNERSETYQSIIREV